MSQIYAILVVKDATDHEFTVFIEYLDDQMEEEIEICGSQFFTGYDTKGTIVLLLAGSQGELKRLWPRIIEKQKNLCIAKNRIKCVYIGEHVMDGLTMENWKSVAVVENELDSEQIVWNGGDEVQATQFLLESVVDSFFSGEISKKRLSSLEQASMLAINGMGSIDMNTAYEAFFQPIDVHWMGLDSFPIPLEDAATASMQQIQTTCQESE